MAIIVTNHMTERNQMYFAHFTFRQSYIMRIASSQRSTMTTKMFRSSIQPHRLVAFNPSSTNLRYQNRILSKCFLTTSPTGILSYIQYRRPCLHSTCRKSFIANCHCHFFRQLLIPSCPHCKSLGKDSSSTTIWEAMYSFHLCNGRYIQMRNTGNAPALTYQFHFIFRRHHRQQAFYTFFHRKRRVHIA